MIESKNDRASNAPHVVKRVEWSEKLAIEIYLRPSGSFGYLYRHKWDDGSGWIPSINMGPGGIYDSIETAEKYARDAAPNEGM